MGVGEHECVIIENQRWSIRHREYRCDALMPKMDPPAFCTEDGRATSMEAMNKEAERSLLERTPGSALKAWRWKEGSRWRASDWQYAIAFQSAFKVTKDRTCMVRRRMWFRTRTVIARSVAPREDAPACATATAGGDDGTDGGSGGPAVRFADDTVYERELNNRRWRATASTRAAPHWAKQYFSDCAACEISPVGAVAAFLAASGVSVYERQTRARLILAGKEEWPAESPATAAADVAPDALEPLALELQAQLVSDIVELGHAEAVAVATQHLVFAVVNANARDVGAGGAGGGEGGGGCEGCEGGAAADGGAAGADAASSGDGASAPASAAPRSPARGGGVPESQLESFIAQTLTRLEVEASPPDGALGYDTADGWFVLDDLDMTDRVTLHAARATAGGRGGHAANGSGGRSGAVGSSGGGDNDDGGGGDDDDDDDAMYHSTVDRTRGGRGKGAYASAKGLDVDDSMYHSAMELDASVLGAGEDTGSGAAGGGGGGGGGGGDSSGAGSDGGDGGAPQSDENAVPAEPAKATPAQALANGGAGSAAVASRSDARSPVMANSVYFDATDAEADADALAGAGGRRGGDGGDEAGEAEALAAAPPPSSSVSSSSSSSSSSASGRAAAAALSSSPAGSLPSVGSGASALSSSPRSVGSPGANKARIEAEIRMLEDMMRRNREE